jgi:DNA mismatch repair protein MutS
MSEQSTPLMRQHADIKKQHPSALLFFRVGDFYELFFDDAVTAARELQITLTSRQKEKGIAIPMCGVPYHAAENYIARLIRKGYKVAICDQVEDPKLTKKLVRREVTRVVTPGTAVDSQLGSEENNFLTAVVRQHDVVGFAALDLSTGDFRATEFRDTSGSQADSDRRVQEELQTIRAREVLYPTALPLFRAQTNSNRSFDGTVVRSQAAQVGEAAAVATAPVSTFGIAETPLEDWVFAPDYAIPLVENHFGVLSLDGFGLAKHTAAASAAGAILHYIKQTQRGTLTHVDRISYYERAHCLVLDSVTTRNLELVEPLLAGTSDDITLFRAIDHTCTPMGKRLLRAWMLRPSIDVKEINARLDAAEAAIRATIDREELRRSMEGILDIERLLSRVTLEAANPRDVLALAASFAKLPNVKTGAAKLAVDSRSHDGKVARWHCLSTSLDELTDLRERI